ncbi:MAG: hypothetical protein K9H25_18500 [Rhodospirillum sp.]|nr:hypothetical protein [Rhodospirillum sp.]MCF8490745.1 hypothetical protein [Rhodospirillum sp.]MCF8502309.1 hypothetical protein [Rhodospirillum sp.]
MLETPFSGLSYSGRVFCFFDLEHPAVAWAIMRGMMVSADCANPNGLSNSISFMQAGMVEAFNNVRIYNEFIIERIRLRYFSDKISRLKGMFFFRSRDEAEKIIGDTLWPPYFIRENLVELDLYCREPFTDLDSNWITFAPLSQDGRLEINDIQWIMQYWKGEQYNSHPVWERLAKGVALVLDEKIRRHCDQYLKKIFPNSQIPILMARLASEAGTRGGLVSPFLFQEDKKAIKLGYFMNDSEFHDREIIDAIAKHPDSSTLGRMMSENKTWSLPNFRLYTKVFEVHEQNNPILPALQVPSLHYPKR